MVVVGWGVQYVESNLIRGPRSRAGQLVSEGGSVGLPQKCCGNRSGRLKCTVITIIQFVSGECAHTNTHKQNNNYMMRTSTKEEIL